MTHAPPPPAHDDEPTRFFHVHVQKTGGTELQRRLEKHFGSAAIYPNDTDGGQPDSAIVVDHLLQRWAVRRDEIRVVAGHFPLCTRDLLDADLLTLTILRDPVERTLSLLRHSQRDEARFRNASLEDIYAHPMVLHGRIHNHMVKMFGLRTDDMDAGMLTWVDFTPDHLERAKEGLRQVDAIGLQDDFETFFDELGAAYGITCDERGTANVTRPTEVSQEFRDRIATDNALDVELYAYGRALVAERRAAGAPDQR